MKIAALALVAFVLVGCAQTRQARDVAQSGFLGDYSLLKEGPEGGALKVYQNPAADFKSYDKVLLDPVEIWTSGDSQMNELSKEDKEMVANRLYTLMYARLSKDYTMVQQAEPATLHIRVALTSAEQSWPTLDVISTILPQALLLSTLKKGITGRPAFVGEASGEMKITNAETNEVLLEAVDSRVGAKNLSGVTNSWEDVDAAYAYWADRTGYRLCELRGATGCVAPEQ
jgi:hypothetical protein